MKKLFLFLTSAVLSLTASAQGWVQPTNYDKEHVIYATIPKLQTTDNYTVGAFIDGECRAVATIKMDATGAYSEPLRFELRVQGNNEEAGSEITFKVYESSGDTGYTYTLSQTLKFIPEGTTGELSSLYTLNLAKALYYSFNDETINLYPGRTYEIGYTAQDGAQLPDEFDDLFTAYSTGGALPVTVSGKTVIASQDILGSAQIYNTSPLKAFNTLTINVVEQPIPVKSITIDRSKTTTIYVDQNIYLNEYFTVNPSNATNKKVNITANNDNVNIDSFETDNGFDYYLSAKARGTTVVTIASDEDPTITETITFTILQRITKIEPNTSANFNIKKGQTINLADYYIITPTDPDEKDVVALCADSNSPVTIAGSGSNWTLTADNVGTAVVTVQAAYSPNVQTTLTFTIVQPVENIVVNTDPELSYNLFIGHDVCINDYFTILPEDAENKEVTITCSSNLQISKLENDLGTEYYLSGTARGTGTVTITSVDNPQATLTLTFNVKQPVTELSRNESANFNLMVGQTVNLSDYYIIGPDDADNKNVNVDAAKYSDFVEVSGSGTSWTLTALKAGDAHVIVTAEESIDYFTELTFTITQGATEIIISPDVFDIVIDQEVECASDMKIIVMPEGVAQAYTLSTDDTDIVEVHNADASSAYFKGKACGTATITVKAADGSGVSNTFTVNVYNQLEGFELSDGEITMPTQTKKVITIYPYPENPLITEDFIFTIMDPNGNLSGNNSLVGDNDYTSVDNNGTPTLGSTWKYVVGDLSQNEDGYYQIELSAFSVGEGTLNIQYGNDPAIEPMSVPLHVGFQYDLAEGWNWISTFTNGVSDAAQTMEEMLGADLGEGRTQTGLFYNDPVYGYFGDFTDFDATNTFYKLKGKAASSFMLFGGYNVKDAINLRNGWNWIPYNCEYDQNIALKASENDVIVSLTDGFANYTDGAWIPEDFQLRAGEGYMYYTTNPTQLILPDPYSCEQPEVIESTRANVAKQSFWDYNPRLYNSIMPIIAVIEGYDSDDYTVGAFVGDECRGEGRLVDGKWFITVAGQAGELVSFRICDKFSGEMIDVETTVNMASILGSAKAPVKLVAPVNETTSIGSISADANDSDEWYNLQGHRVNNPHGGIYILNGKKVIVK